MPLHGNTSYKAQKEMQKDVHCSIIYNSEKVETT